MADCVHCGESAGLLRKTHSECRKRHSVARERMVWLASQAAVGKRPINSLMHDMQGIQDSTLVKPDELKSVLRDGWDAAVNTILEAYLPSAQEESHLATFVEHFSLRDDGGSRAARELLKGIVLRELMEGKIPRPPNFGRLPFNMLPSESLIWSFPGVRYYERRTKIIRKGVSHGASIRVMKGVYYQPRVFRSEPVEVNETRLIDEGIVALTTQNIYFAGQEKSLRIPYKRVLSFDGYADGFSITRNAESAKPQIFLTGDGWFSYNVVAHLVQGSHGA